VNNENLASFIGFSKPPTWRVVDGMRCAEVIYQGVVKNWLMIYLMNTEGERKRGQLQLILKQIFSFLVYVSLILFRRSPISLNK